MTYKLFAIPVICLSLLACQEPGSGTGGNKDQGNVVVAGENDSLVSETYTGTLPCLDCEGIETTVELSRMSKQDFGSFTMKMLYKGRTSDDSTAAYAGNWSTLPRSTDNPGAIIIELNLDDLGNKEFFRRKGTDILMLDRSKQEIPTLLNYTLTRVQ